MPDLGPLNIILYGPPGTGKTYLTQRRALEILEPGADGLSDADVSKRFRQYLKDGRIEFITFHPSYSYEEFVEGFRYDENKKVPTRHDGIFKSLVKRASGSRQSQVRKDAKIWKLSLGDYRSPRLFDRCIRNGEIAIGWFGDKNLTDRSKEDIEELFDGGSSNSVRSVNNFVNEMMEGDYVVIRKNQREIRAIGIVSGEYKYKYEVYGEDHPHIRPVEWLDQRDHDIYEINDHKELSEVAVYPLKRVSPEDLVELLPRREQSEEPHVLIIDEINRGNLSRIFGELITLLEEDKRGGAKSELSARLPYSGKPFTVPANLHVIGTMNTADRSIALLDTALRRRFQFEEMRPDAAVIGEILRASGCADEHVDLVCEVFEALNKRVAVLLDRDHQIGHSYFLDAASIEDLHRVLYHRVFPLLQEYFYNDPQRLRDVLGAYDATNQRGFVRPMREYGEALEEAVPDEDLPWEFHEYKPEELETALRNTFRVG